MTKRFFKATDGEFTVFRASATMHYRSAIVRGKGSISFSSASGGYGSSPVEEITKSEYETLVARKNTRLKSEGKDPGRYTTPRHSWVRNAALVEG